MIKITNEIDGKKYELVPETYICEGCDLKKKCSEVGPKMVHSVFNKRAICGKLHGIWKEVNDAD